MAGNHNKSKTILRYIFSVSPYEIFTQATQKYANVNAVLKNLYPLSWILGARFTVFTLSDHVALMTISLVLHWRAITHIWGPQSEIKTLKTKYFNWDGNKSKASMKESANINPLTTNVPIMIGTLVVKRLTKNYA